MRILDMSAGRRGIWFNKNHPDATYLDCRPEVNPDMVADTRKLPEVIGKGFGLVVFDPPHINFGKNGKMSKNYGHHTTAQIRDIIALSAFEAHRVSAKDAFMAFKWNTHDQPLQKVLALMAEWWEPLFGHKVSVRTMRASTTYWVMLRRK